MFIGDPKVFFFYSVRDNFKYFWGVPKDTTLNIIKKYYIFSISFSDHFSHPYLEHIYYLKDYSLFRVQILNIYS